MFSGDGMVLALVSLLLIVYALHWSSTNITDQLVHIHPTRPPVFA